MGYNRDEMRITYRDGWTETFITASRVVFDGGSMARICRMEQDGPSDVPRERVIVWTAASQIAEVCAL